MPATTRTAIAAVATLFVHGAVPVQVATSPTDDTVAAATPLRVDGIER